MSEKRYDIWAKGTKQLASRKAEFLSSTGQIRLGLIMY